ncbi:MAG: hypothetical protein WEF86_04405 [Gemmatimonadota bacterium]
MRGSTSNATEEDAVFRLHAFAMPLTVFVTVADIPTIPTLHMPAPTASGIVAAADGTVYFVDSFRNTVWKVHAGEAATVFVAGRNGQALQLDADGNLYGMHEHDDDVVLWRADAAGTVTAVARPHVPAHFGHAFVLADNGDIIGSSGTGRRSGVRLWRANDRERHLLAGGEWGFQDGAGAEARFFPIGGMARAPGGGLVVTSGATIRRVAPDGSVTTVAAGQPLLSPKRSFLSRLFGDVQGHLTGVAVGDSGEIYVTNSARGAVMRVDRNGEVVELSNASDGWSPTGVAAAGGSVYVLEYGPGVRVRRIDAAGRSVILAIVRSDPIAALPLQGRFRPLPA